MRVCQCAKRVCNKGGHCDVQAAVDRANLNRQAKGQLPLSNRHEDIELAVGTFYDNHKAETGKKPCHGCKPFIRREVTDILSGEACEGALPERVRAA